ncbi:MAG: EthD family reductase [Rhodospirillales bacterium]
MVSYFIRYRGSPSQPDAFLDYYRVHHATILRRFPQIRSLILSTPASVVDPFPVKPAGSALLAQMVFDNTAALQAALLSQARKDARDDFSLLPSFDGEITHEALTAEVVF